MVKVRLLNYLKDRVGEELDAVITGVADYGFYAQGVEFPAEGLVHVRTLGDDFYAHEPTTHTLEGRKARQRYRLGDMVRVAVEAVDVPKRQLAFRVVTPPEPRRTKKKPK